MIGIDGFVFMGLACATAVMAPVGNDRLARLRTRWATALGLCICEVALTMLVRVSAHVRPSLLWLMVSVELAAFSATFSYWLRYRREKKS
ncbi:hypothetical protein [Sphingomonas oryzagri]